LDVAVACRQSGRVGDCADDLSRERATSVEKNELKPHLRQQYVIAPEQSAEFVVHMEDVLEIYHRRYDPRYPVICMDEQPVQLVKQTRIPL